MKNKIARITCSILFIIFSVGSIFGQIGAGLVTSIDMYQRYTNPDDGLSENLSSGSALLNLSAGPKIWIGAKDFSVSIESQANLGILGFSLNENKGLGQLAIPVIANLNFSKLSGLAKSDGVGFVLGGGIQYNHTELYGVKEEFKLQGIQRDFFRTYIIQAGVGFGITGFGGILLARYGFDPDSNASSLNIGLQLDMNFIMMKNIDDPASQL